MGARSDPRAQKGLSPAQLLALSAVTAGIAEGTPFTTTSVPVTCCLRRDQGWVTLSVSN